MGFVAASALLADPIRKAGESRGFAVTRLLTHWSEIVGSDLAATTRPVKMGYGRDSFGATLTVLVQGAVAPLVEMQKARIRDRVNACYGYAAVTRIAMTQTSAGGFAGTGFAAPGFAEGQAAFAPAPRTKAPDPAVSAAAQAQTSAIQDESLRLALERLAANILSRPKADQKGNR